MNEIERRLEAAGITLPEAPAPAANYVPAQLGAGLLFVAGQLPLADGRVQQVGKLGGGVGLEDGRAAARLCAINILAQAKKALAGDLSRIKQTLKVQGFVACTPDFGDHPKVINGASDLLVEALGEAGKHARFALGAPSLPFDAAVEVDATFEVA
ncbi:MAG: RidA family protein [Alphaproteobacteria bacterium]|jgi:enamine deaminase RidA (YjgF/YER057c/UK114 family)|nr:RidA family protein [Alphaproteobacteria bacterium]